MSRMIRAFVAVRVDCEPELRRVLRELNEMGRAVRAMPPDQLHVSFWATCHSSRRPRSLRC
jgi:hypothetical protein